MQRGSHSERDLSQSALAPKIQSFLSYFGEALPNWAARGLCSGYGFMLFRAKKIGQSDQYWQRLIFLADADDAAINGMATQLLEYQARFRKKVQDNVELLKFLLVVYRDCGDQQSAKEATQDHYQYIDQLARQGLNDRDQLLLDAAIDLYAFISSLVFSQSPNECVHLYDGLPMAPESMPRRGAINQMEFLEILKLLAPDELIENQHKKLHSYVIAFQFSWQELIHTLNFVTRDGDFIRLSGDSHTVYISKQGDRYALAESNDSNGEVTHSCSELVQSLQENMFSAYQHTTQYPSVSIQIYSFQNHKRATPEDVVKAILVQRGAAKNIDVADMTGITALAIAAKVGCYDVVKILLLQGADPNKPDNDGWTPAIFAAFHGHERIIALLAEFNADLSKVNADGDGPRSLAERYKHQRVMDQIDQRSLKNLLKRKVQTPKACQQKIHSLQLFISQRSGDASDLSLLTSISGDNAHKRQMALLIIHNRITLAKTAQEVLAVIKEVEVMKENLSYLYPVKTLIEKNKFFYKHNNVRCEWAKLILLAQGKVKKLVRADPDSADAEVAQFLRARVVDSYGWFCEAKSFSPSVSILSRS